jgi:type IV pilus assembly protein PilQ
MKTTVVLRDGETLCLGGLIRKNKTEVRSAVPFLGSIPILGRLFSYTSEEEDESELAIFITPSVDVRRENGSASLQTRGKIDGKL